MDDACKTVLLAVNGERTPDEIVKELSAVLPEDVVRLNLDLLRKMSMIEANDG
jgi:hypothetical protein